MLNKEIGSEFWEADQKPNGKFYPGERVATSLLSGRTALDFIVRDIKVSGKICSAYLPSYCCHSMIQPFLDNGVDVKFYRVTFVNGTFVYDLDSLADYDAVLIMQYFGFGNLDVKEQIRCCKEQGKIVIEDATHSFFSETPYCGLSDYVFASIRKWTGLPGGAVAFKHSGDFLVAFPRETNSRFIEMRTLAAELKRQYICGISTEKEVFLDFFARAEDLLEKDYSDYNLPEELEKRLCFLDSEKIISGRRRNAALLIEKIKKLSAVETPTLKSGDVPLFVPIFLPVGRRNELRRYLIERAVYCPVHWPASQAYSEQETSLSTRELSLICDQRYSETDMMYISELVCDFWEGKK